MYPTLGPHFELGISFRASDNRNIFLVRVWSTSQGVIYDSNNLPSYALFAQFNLRHCPGSRRESAHERLAPCHMGRIATSGGWNDFLSSCLFVIAGHRGEVRLCRGDTALYTLAGAGYSGEYDWHSADESRVRCGFPPSNNRAHRVALRAWRNANAAAGYPHRRHQSRAEASVRALFDIPTDSEAGSVGGDESDNDNDGGNGGGGMVTRR